MHATLFNELALVIAIGAGVALIMRLIRQPLIIGHIITGLIVGPSLLNLINDDQTIRIFASIGITLLLFIIGLGLNPKVIKEVGKVSSITGVGQVIFTTLIGFLLVNKLLGYGLKESLFIAVALAFSSTIIILKLLSDKKEQNRLYGKISIGFLLVQDLIATIVLIVTAALGEGSSYFDLARVLSLGLGISIAVLLLSMYILPYFNKFISSSQELLFLFAIGWGLGIATLYTKVGLSLEVGALIAGVALASMPYAKEVASRLRPVRDFFIIMFFVVLGVGFNLSNGFDILPQAIFLSLFVLVGNPIIVMTIMGILGFTKQTSFKAGLTVAQISEFSLVFIILGFNNNQISESIVGLVTVVAIITIAASSYMIIYSDRLYRMMQKYLNIFERKNVKHSDKIDRYHDAIIFGYKKGGSEFIKVLKQMKKKFLVIDYDPEVIDHTSTNYTDMMYGDATDVDLLDEIHLDNSKLVVSTVGDFPTNMFLAEWLENNNPKVVYICAAETQQQAAQLYDEGASYVMMPHFIGSEKISSFIKHNGFSKTEFRKFREKHLEHLEHLKVHNE